MTKKFKKDTYTNKKYSTNYWSKNPYKHCRRKGVYQRALKRKNPDYTIDDSCIDTILKIDPEQLKKTDTWPDRMKSNYMKFYEKYNDIKFYFKRFTDIDSITIEAKRVGVSIDDYIYYEKKTHLVYHHSHYNNTDLYNQELKKMLFDPNFDIDTMHDEMIKKGMMTQEHADQIDNLLDKFESRSTRQILHTFSVLDLVDRE
tara:strand:+ start:1150 stop:1752 length:603 start_codon:yes stop_codon:yes gene_type:complete